MASDLVSDPVRDPLSLFDLSGSVIAITGASGAFGRIVALATARLGARLLLASGSESGLASVAKEICEAGGECQTLVRRPNSVEDAGAILGAAVDAYGTVNSVLVASGYNKPGPIEEMSYEVWQEIMDANVRGPWLMAKAFGTLLLERNARGKLVLVSSVRGRHGSPAGYSAYSTSKGATDSLTKTLATEWGPRGINVNAIAPTVFRSSLTDWIFSDTDAGRDSRNRNLARIPMKRLGEPEDFIGIAMYLLSSASDFVTGQIIFVDGGYTAA